MALPPSFHAQLRSLIHNNTHLALHRNGPSLGPRCVVKQSVYEDPDAPEDYLEIPL